MTDLTDLLQAAVGFVLSIPWARMVYSAVLLFLIGLFGSELYHVWLDRTLFVGRFEFFDDGGRSDENAHVDNRRCS